jgi:acetyl-CoA carboxylase biotin carboxyl carrier protein
MGDETLEAIHRLLSIADSFHLRELVVEEGGVRITIRGDQPIPVAAPAAPPDVLVPDWAEPEPEEDAEEDPAHHFLRSPLTGVFYRSASPDTPPFVTEGQSVVEGQTIGLIEAMKVFSEIPADVSGVVTRIVAEPGKLLQEGDVMLEIDAGDGDSA